MTSTKIIRKYANRKLYDTELSRYINLDDVGVLIRNAIPFVVLAKEGGHDVTADVLGELISARAPEIGAAILLDLLQEVA